MSSGITKLEKNELEIFWLNVFILYFFQLVLEILFYFTLNIINKYLEVIKDFSKKNFEFKPY